VAYFEPQERVIQCFNTWTANVVDATKSNEQRKLLEAELEAVGIRLNTAPPDGTQKAEHDQDCHDLTRLTSVSPSSRLQAQICRRDHGESVFRLFGIRAVLTVIVNRSTTLSS